MGIRHWGTQVVLAAALVMTSIYVLMLAVPSAGAATSVHPGALASKVARAATVPARGASAAHVRSSPDAVSTWRILLLIFRQTDTDYVDASGATRHLQATLPQSDIDALLAAFHSSLPAAIEEWSHNQAAWDVEVEYPSQSVTRLASLGSDTQWLDPSCISAAMQQYFRPGYHDVVMVYWDSSDDAGNTIPSPGWGLATLRSNPSYGYLTVTWPSWGSWDPVQAEGNMQVWIHEWLHSVCFFYEGLGYNPPAGGPDGATTHGYYPEEPPYAGWGTYYSDLMNDRVPENGVMTGIPTEAWARATIRDANDVVPPVTTQAGADDAWHNRPVTVSFSATDSGSPVSGVYSTEYKVDRGAWTTGTNLTVPAPSDHSGDGVHTVSYRSSDAVGNREITRSVSVKIDTTGPTTMAKSVGARRGKVVTLRYLVSDNLSPQATDATLVVKNASGKVVRSFSLGTVNTGITYAVKWKPSAKGVYSYTVTARDLAGNAQATATSARVTVR